VLITAPGRVVAVVPNENNTAFGGTLWKVAEDGKEYARGRDRWLSSQRRS